jgi:hypothetical protein
MIGGGSVAKASFEFMLLATSCPCDVIVVSAGAADSLSASPVPQPFRNKIPKIKTSTGIFMVIDVLFTLLSRLFFIIYRPLINYLSPMMLT